MNPTFHAPSTSPSHRRPASVRVAGSGPALLRRRRNEQFRGRAGPVQGQGRGRAVRGQARAVRAARQEAAPAPAPAPAVHAPGCAHRPALHHPCNRVARRPLSRRGSHPPGAHAAVRGVDHDDHAGRPEPHRPVGELFWSAMRSWSCRRPECTRTRTRKRRRRGGLTRGPARPRPGPRRHARARLDVWTSERGRCPHAVSVARQQGARPGPGARTRRRSSPRPAPAARRPPRTTARTRTTRGRRGQPGRRGRGRRRPRRPATGGPPPRTTSGGRGTRTSSPRSRSGRRRTGGAPRRG